MLTVYRKKNKLDENVVYDIVINGCFMAKIKDGEKVVIDMSDRDSLNFTLSDENNYKMQIKSDTRKSNEVVFDYEEHQTVEFECVSDYIEGPLSCLLNKVMKKDGIKLEKTKDFLLY